MRGALLITLGALISRILGAVYRPVAQFFLGDDGLALVTPPASAYQVILAVSAVGINVAISRLVSQRLALGDYRGARHVFRVATTMLLTSGLVFSVLFGLGARQIAEWYEFPNAWAGFLVLSPAIFLVTLECAFRGLYQGMQRMRPSAISQVVEQAGRVAIGLVMVALVTPIALNFGAAAFNAGNTVGVLLGALYGGYIYFRERPTATWTANAPGVESLEHESLRSLLGKILSIAAPLSLIGAVLPLMQLIDSKVVAQQLTALGLLAAENHGLSSAKVLEEARNSAQLAVAYLANAGTLRDLPSILTTALYVSLVPAVTESVATGRLDQARYRASTAFRITFLVGIPATVGLLVGARDAYAVLFSGGGYTVMAPLAWSTIFLMLQQTSSGTLQGMGLIWVSVRNLLLGVAVKTVLTYWWTSLPALQASGAAYATGVAFALTAGLNLWMLRRKLGLTLQLKDDIGRPLLAAAAMGLVLWLSSPVVHALIPVYRLASLIVIGLGGLVYLVTIFAVGGVTEADLHMIPGVRPGMIQRLRRYRLLRD